MPVQSGRTALAEAAREFFAQWEQAKGYWTDRQSREFERTYIEPLREAVKAAHIARELSGSRFIKVEIHPNPQHLMPDPIETLEAGIGEAQGELAEAVEAAQEAAAYEPEEDDPFCPMCGAEF